MINKLFSIDGNISMFYFDSFLAMQDFEKCYWLGITYREF